MRNRLCILIAACLFSLLLIHSVHAEVDWEILKTMKLGGNPVDFAVAPNGSRIYVLTENGQLCLTEAGRVYLQRQMREKKSAKATF